MLMQLFRRREAMLPLIAASATCLGLLAVGASAHAADVSGNAALTTDYIFRGISQTQGDPAAQFGVKIAAANGLYGNVWASTVEFPGDTGASTELDTIVGWSGKLADDWALDVNATHFGYPSARADLAYTELIGTLTWRDNYWLMVGYSSDVFATDATGVYTQLGARFPIGERFRIEAAIARYDLDDAYGRSYSHASLGAVWAFNAPGAQPGLELRVTAHDTDAGAKAIFPGLAGSRIEAALQAAF
jgi:uncharacterized protein (TIGR02001 family)